MKNQHSWTMKQIELLRNYSGKLTFKEMMEGFEREFGIKLRKGQLRGIIKRNNISVKRERNAYTMYKDEEIIACGNLDEMSEQLGIGKQSILAHGTPKRTIGRNKIMILVKIS